MPKRKSKALQNPGAQSRLRAYAACTECRRRKRKCDGREPCSSCYGYGYNCVYHPDVARSEEDGATVRINDHRNRDSHDLSPIASSRAHRTLDSSQRVSDSHLFVNKHRGRFINAHSAVALPYLVGSSLDADTPPRLHSFSWNMGVRAEVKRTVTSLSSLITLEECRRLSSVYFAAVHPMFAFLSPTDFLERLNRDWGSIECQPHFAAVVAAVAALGSYFDETDHSQPQLEEALVRYSFSLLDFAFSTPAAAIDVDSVSGWILRTIYVRLTTRPSVASLASQTALHMAEVIGLHRELPEKTFSCPGKPVKMVSETEREARRHIFWTAKFLNHLISVDYGLRPVNLSKITCLPPTAIGQDTHMEQVKLFVQILETMDEESAEGLDLHNLHDQMLRVEKIPDDFAPIVSIFKADVCLGMLRRLVSASIKPSKEIRDSFISIIRKSLECIPTLLAMRRLWWNLLSIPFQTVCISLHVDDSTILALLPTAMNIIRSIAESLDSHLANEALSTAQQLIHLSRDRTNAKLELKNSALGDVRPDIDLNWNFSDETFDMSEWPISLDFLYST